jgi:hypothetical protein
MPLVEGCTEDELYRLLEELGEDVDALRKRKLKFKELEKLYYKRLDEKLKEVWNYRANRASTA